MFQTPAHPTPLSGDDVGFEVDNGVGFAEGAGVGFEEGAGVGFEVGAGVRFEVGDGVGFEVDALDAVERQAGTRQPFCSFTQHH